MNLIADIATSGPTISLLLFIIVKIIPNSKLEKWFETIGAKQTAWGRKSLGKAYEKIEKFEQDTIGVCMKAYFKGLDKDDGG